MKQFISKDDVKKYIVLPKNFDWDLVDQENGFSKIFQIVPEDVYGSLEESDGDVEKEIFRLLTKAAIYYSFILAFPRLKVQINNAGIKQFELDKVKNAPWYDVRDLGISMLKIADRCLSDSITKISKIESLKSEIPFFSQVSEFISTPEELESIYSINYSPDVFLMLQKFIKKSLLLLIEEKIKTECLEQIKEKDDLLSNLKDALVFYSLYYASLLPGFVFTQNAVVIQYEELPWQKSLILDSHAKILSGQNFLKLGDDSLKIITDYIKKNIGDFPCYAAPVPNRKIQARPSGLYLT